MSTRPPYNTVNEQPVSPVLEPGHTYASVTDKISAIVLTRPTSLGWVAGFALSFTLVMVLTVSLAWLIIKGVGIWGINIPVGWGFAIVNFVWWIGIGHAGTLISAILFLLNQKWRTSINRFAEAMTLFAVACAGIFPLIHTGRPWMAYYMFPYPSTMYLWPQFRSPLIWDVFAVSTYGTVSLLFWFVGLIPDLATLRDRALKKPMQIIYGMLAMGWRGSSSLCTPWLASTLRSPLFLAGTLRFFRPTSLPALFTPASPWCSPSPFRFARPTTSRTSLPCTTSKTWPR